MTNVCDTDANALHASWKIQSDVSARGFDWPDITGVFAKVREELEEIEAAWNDGDTQHAQRELGDLLFATVNLARFLDTDPNAELARTNDRFLQRFAIMEERLKSIGRQMEHCTLEELDAVWDDVKRAMASGARKRA